MLVILVLSVDKMKVVNKKKNEVFDIVAKLLNNKKV